jgi:hypothetical protein
LLCHRRASHFLLMPLSFNFKFEHIILHTVGVLHADLLDHVVWLRVSIWDLVNLPNASINSCFSNGRFVGRPRFVFEEIFCKEK